MKSHQTSGMCICNWNLDIVIFSTKYQTNTMVESDRAGYQLFGNIILDPNNS